MTPAAIILLILLTLLLLGIIGLWQARTRQHEAARQQIVDLLQESGMWTAIRARPFGRVPSPSSAAPHSLFVTVTDTNPHAPSVDKVLAGRETDFEAGLSVVAKLTEGKVYVCKGPSTKIPAGKTSNVQIEEFHGPHPSGTVGLHIHTLDPVSRKKNRVAHRLPGCDRHRPLVCHGPLAYRAHRRIERAPGVATAPYFDAPRRQRYRTRQRGNYRFGGSCRVWVRAERSSRSRVGSVARSLR
jgi:Tfp pilus assembly protein PilV